MKGRYRYAACLHIEVQSMMTLALVVVLAMWTYWWLLPLWLSALPVVRQPTQLVVLLLVLTLARQPVCCLLSSL